MRNSIKQFNKLKQSFSLLFDNTHVGHYDITQPLIHPYATIRITYNTVYSVPLNTDSFNVLCSCINTSDLLGEGRSSL